MRFLCDKCMRSTEHKAPFLLSINQSLPILHLILSISSHVTGCIRARSATNLIQLYFSKSIYSICCMKAKIIQFCFVLLSQCDSPQDNHFTQTVISTIAESMEVADHTWNWIGCWQGKVLHTKIILTIESKCLWLYIL